MTPYPLIVGAGENEQRFANSKKDPETGLNYFGARYMDGTLGRFSSPDPIGPVDAATGKINQAVLKDPRRLNPYAYGLNNPYKFVDPDGESPLLVIGLLAGYYFLKSEEVANAPNVGDQLQESHGTRDMLKEAAVDFAALGNISNLSGLVSKSATTLWPAASEGRHVINGIEYTTHALERMAPRGLIQKGTEMVSRGVTPSVVENAIKVGAKSPGNTAGEIVHTFENVRVVTNPDATRVITVITTGR